MILGTGIDVVSTEVMRRELERADWNSADGIFSPAELSDRATSPIRQLSACFAVKEAALKALGLPISDLDCFREVEVKGAEAGRIKVSLHGRAQRQSIALGVKRVLAALHSDRKLAAAMVILEG